MAWKDVNECLIEEVRKYPCIYDISREDYKDMIKKNNSWLAIAKTLNVELEFARRRWANLRDRYKKILKENVGNQNNFSSGSTTLIKKKGWKYSNLMCFLSPMNNCTNIVENISPDSEINPHCLDISLDIPIPTQLDITSIETDDKSMVFDAFAEMPDSISEKNLEAENNSDKNTASTSNNKQPSSVRQSAKHNRTLNRGQKRKKNWKDELFKLLASSQEDISEKDDDYYYCMSLVGRLRRIKSTKIKNYVRLKIEQAFIDAEEHL